jgi:hypothetical protein
MRNLPKLPCAYKEKVDETRDGLQHTAETLETDKKGTGTSQSEEAANFSLFKWNRVCVCRDNSFSISYSTGELILLFLWSDI